MGARGDPKFRDLLLNAATEEIGHIEMLATAVALTLEGANVGLKEEIAADPVASSVLGGTNLKNFLSAGMSAMPVDSDGVPFDMSHIYASGNIAADIRQHRRGIHGARPGGAARGQKAMPRMTGMELARAIRQDYRKFQSYWRRVRGTCR